MTNLFLSDIETIDDTASLISKYVDSVNIEGISTDNLQKRMNELYAEAIELV